MFKTFVHTLTETDGSVLKRLQTNFQYRMREGDRLWQDCETPWFSFRESNLISIDFGLTCCANGHLLTNYSFDGYVYYSICHRCPLANRTTKVPVIFLTFIRAVTDEINTTTENLMSNLRDYEFRLSDQPIILFEET